MFSSAGECRSERRDLETNEQVTEVASLKGFAGLSKECGEITP